MNKIRGIALLMLIVMLFNTIGTYATGDIADTETEVSSESASDTSSEATEETETGNSPVYTEKIIESSEESAPDINAEAAIVVEANTKQVVYAKNTDKRMYPASTTKIMTALLAYEYGNLDDVITASSTAVNHSSLVSGGSTVGIVAGEQLTLRELLYCLLLPSANEVACILAEYVAGNVEDFVTLMNEKAKELGCTDTHFANPHGLTNENHYTTAHDMYCIAYEFAKQEELMEIANTTSITIEATNKSEERVLTTTNHLISTRTKTDYIYEYARGIKTGYTSAAKHCLVSTAQNNGLYFICIVLGCPVAGTETVTSFTDSKSLYQWAFKTFELKTIVKKGTAVTEAYVSLSDDKDSVVLETDRDITVLLQKEDYDESLLQIVPPETVVSLTAPVDKGAAVATAHVYYNGIDYGEVGLVTATSAKLSEFMDVSEKSVTFFKSTLFITILVSIGVIFVIYIVYITIAAKKRRNRNVYGRRYR